MILCCGSCSHEKAIPSFDGGRAYEYLKEQAAFGPRVPGTDDAIKCREYLISFFRGLKLEVDTMSFIHQDKQTGRKIPMTNILIHIKGIDSANNACYLLAAHWDSRPRADRDLDSTKWNNPIDGANDGASGVAVLMELANLFTQAKPRVNVDLVLLDGEDWGREGDLDEYFLGAKDFIQRNIRGKYKFAILVDMVGDKDLKIYREEFSNHYYPKLTDQIWGTASKLGEKAFIDSVGYAVMDDHLSFMTIGIPSAVIIDFNYAYWHTVNDTPDKCSPQSLGVVGRVLAALIYGL